VKHGERGLEHEQRDLDGSRARETPHKNYLFHVLSTHSKQTSRSRLAKGGRSALGRECQVDSRQKKWRRWSLAVETG
jgi:hypothetical protein